MKRGSEDSNEVESKENDNALELKSTAFTEMSDIPIELENTHI